MNDFVQSTAFSILLFLAAVILLLVGVFGGVHNASLVGLVCGFGAVVHFLVMHL